MVRYSKVYYINLYINLWYIISHYIRAYHIIIYPGIRTARGGKDGDTDSGGSSDGGDDNDQGNR